MARGVLVVPGFGVPKTQRLDVGGAGSVDRHVPRLWQQVDKLPALVVPKVACRCGGNRGRRRFVCGYFMHAVDIVPPLFIALHPQRRAARHIIIEHGLRMNVDS